MSKIYFKDDDDPIDIRYDNVFKAVFTKDTPNSRGALSRLISALIGRQVTVSSINANEPPIDDLRNRQIRFDISCKTKKGELVNIEMSLNPDPYEPVRLEFHAGKLFTGQDIKGSDKTYNDLKEAYQITILAKQRFFQDDVFLHTFEYYDPLHQISLKGKSRIIAVELSKLEKVVEKPTVKMSAQEYWAVYFGYLTDKTKRQKINEIVKREEGIAMASEVLITVSRDEIERARLQSEYKGQLDYQSKMVHAKREGLKEGRKEGLQKGLQQGIQQGIQEGSKKEQKTIAQKMKEMGLTDDQILTATGVRV
jgi:predicted transposase/invertase (TIGR01784 family)